MKFREKTLVKTQVIEVNGGIVKLENNEDMAICMLLSDSYGNKIIEADEIKVGTIVEYEELHDWTNSVAILKVYNNNDNEVVTMSGLNNNVLSTIEPIKVNSAVRCTSDFVNRDDLVALSDKEGNWYIARRENYVKDFENHEFSFTGNYIKINRNIYQLSSGTWEDETIKEHNLFSDSTIEEIHDIYDFVNNLNLDARVEAEENKQVNEVINSSSKENNNIVEIKENVKTDYNFCYNFLNDKSDIQKAKILKILNTKMTYNNKAITRKDFIHTLLKEYDINNIKLDIYNNTDRYSSRKVCLTYKKLQDKKEYKIHLNDDGEKFYYQVTKTEYDYINYLLDSKLKEVI